MTTLKALEERHSVRNYSERPIPEDIRYLLDRLVEECNEESGLRIRICYDDPDGFDSRLAHYGKVTERIRGCLIRVSPSVMWWLPEGKCLTGFKGEWRQLCWHPLP